MPNQRTGKFNHDITSVRYLWERPRDCINSIMGVSTTCPFRRVLGLHAGRGISIAGGADAWQQET